MALRVRTGSFLEELEERATAGDSAPVRNPHGMCILSGQLLKQNLKETLNRRNLQTATLSHYTTIEDLSSSILEPTDEPASILASGIRDRLVEGILAAADPDPDPDEDIVPVEFGDTLRTAEERELEALASRLPYTEEDTRESFIEELDDFYRWTDAATNVAPATRELAQLDNRFAQVQSNRALTAFGAIEEIIEKRLAELGINRHQSRSHLVHTARDHLDKQWPSQYGHVEWISIAGISVFDNPTLRFLETLASHESGPDVEVFLGKGSAEYNFNRFDALSILSDDSSDPNSAPDLDSEAAETLLAATSEPPEGVPEKVEFVETPSEQRAIEDIATEVRELVQDGTHPREILIVAPDAGNYQSLVEQAFETVEVPVHVETRRPYANIPAYRCFRTLIDVVDAVANGQPITYGELVDPLRLGYCPRGSHGDTWPIEGRAFTKVEQELHRKQRFYNSDPDRYEDQGIEFDVWTQLIEDIPAWTGPWDEVLTYLSDIENLAEKPPANSTELIDLFGSYLGTYVFQTVDHKRALSDGPAIDLTRTTLDERHATNEAEHVRNALADVGSHYDRVQELFDAPESWAEVGRAFSAAVGQQSYGKSHLDQYAVPVVDTGNAYFRDADHVFLVGMDAEVFPSKASTPTFLHRELRQAVHRQAKSGETPYHHLDSRSSSYGEALDFYQAALSTLRQGGEIRLYHTYRDERGNQVSWSPFVDLFDVTDEDNDDRPVERLSVGEWIPGLQSDSETWEELTGRVAPRERLRMLLYYAHRERIEGEGTITEEGVDAIAGGLEHHPLSALILPRVERHQHPPTSVNITPEEPAFSEISLEAVTGSPHQPHELDLQAQCGLKYYYYQFLYNFTGDDPTRAEIPKYYSQNPHWRLGEIPYIVRDNYADPRYVGKWRDIITTLLPNRQSTTDGLAQFDSADELRAWVQDEFDSYDLNTIYPNLLAERELVIAERDAGITREWCWRMGGEVTIDGSELAVPEYRLDRIQNEDSEYAIPIFFTRFTRRGRSALKSCFDGEIWETDERTNGLCLDCGREDRCQYHSKYVIDHRMIAGQQHESRVHDAKVVGIGMQEQYAGPTDGNRVVAIQNNYIDKVSPDAGSFEQLIPRGYPQNWDSSVDSWKANFSQLTADLNTNDEVVLEANPTVVNRDDCLECVYHDLCQVPDSGVDLG